MSRFVLFACLLALAAGETRLTPVEKVIHLLQKLEQESAAEGRAEAQSYDKFACFCKAQADEKLYSIAKASDKVDFLAAKIKKLTGEVTELNADVGEGNTRSEALEQEMAEDLKIRNDDHHAFQIQLNDLVDAIKGTEEAMEQMENSKTPGTFLLQVAAKEQVSQVLRHVISHGSIKTSRAQTAVILSLLDMTAAKDPAGDAMGAASASKFHSGEIIEKLQSVLKGFKVNKVEHENQEAEKKHTFDMGANAKGNQLAVVQQAVANCEANIASKEEEMSKCEADKEKTNADKDSDQNFLDALTEECEAKAKSWDQRSKARSNELSALAEALEILKGKVSQNYGANKELNLAQTNKGNGHWEWVSGSASFLQVSHHHHVSDVDHKVIKYLQREAKRTQSPVIATLLLRMKSDHFKKVRDMIKDMVAKLQADADSEETQKGWCDDEMKKSTAKRDENIGNTEGDLAAITKTKATIDMLTEDIHDLEAEISELYNNKNDATALRATEKAENAKTLSDAKAGLKAINAAVKVLEDFYSKSLVQVSAAPPKGADASGETVADKAPKVAEGEYKGNKDQSAGIIGMMDVIVSDFKGTIEATETAETDAAAEFKKFSKDSDSALTEKKDLVTSKKSELKTGHADLNGFKEDLRTHSSLKLEALDELAKLKPACVSGGATNAERMARRNQEIESLKSAVQIFETMSFLDKRH